WSRRVWPLPRRRPRRPPCGCAWGRPWKLPRCEGVDWLQQPRWLRANLLRRHQRARRRGKRYPWGLNKVRAGREPSVRSEQRETVRSGQNSATKRCKLQAEKLDSPDADANARAKTKVFNHRGHKGTQRKAGARTEQ